MLGWLQGMVLYCDQGLKIEASRFITRKGSLRRASKRGRAHGSTIYVITRNEDPSGVPETRINVAKKISVANIGPLFFGDHIW